MHRIYCRICKCVVGFADMPVGKYTCKECVYSGRAKREGN